MKNIYLTVTVILSFTLVNAQVQVRQTGKVHYFVVPFNEPLALRDDSIAHHINDYIAKKAPKNFPDILLYITNQNPKSSISNFEEVLVYYQKYRGEFFEKDILIYDKEHIGISLALFKNHYQKGMEAVKYAVSNFKKLKKKEKRLSKKKNNDTLIDEDLKSFELPK
jgi:hypothetical protein